MVHPYRAEAQATARFLLQVRFLAMAGTLASAQAVEAAPFLAAGQQPQAMHCLAGQVARRRAKRPVLEAASSLAIPAP